MSAPSPDPNRRAFMFGPVPEDYSMHVHDYRVARRTERLIATQFEQGRSLIHEVGGAHLAIGSSIFEVRRFLFEEVHS